MNLDCSKELISWPSEVIRDGFIFSPLRHDDLDMLHTWLNTPHIAVEWDGGVSKEDVFTKYAPKIDDSSIRAYIVHHDGAPLGFMQVYQASKVGGGWYL